MKHKKANQNTNPSTVFIQLLALAIIVMIFVMFIAKQTTTQRAAITPSPTPLTDVQGINFSKQGSSDEVTEIEADLKATDFSKLDTGISDIDTDLSE